MNKQIDGLDISILKLLQRDSSLPYKQIAGKLNSSTTTVCDRIKRLKKNGFITRFVAVLSPEKLQMEIVAYVHLNLSGYSENIIGKLKQDLSRIEEVCACTRITGYYSIKLKVMTSSSTDFSNIERYIAGLENVKAVQSYIVLRNIIEDNGFVFD